MPCRDDGYPQPETVPAWMLCEAMVIIQNCERLRDCSAQLQEWWAKHQMKEEDRVRAEAAAKLSERERLALGIDDKGQNVRTRVIKRKR